MFEQLKRRKHHVGLPPGTLEVPGEPRARGEAKSEAWVQALAYGPDEARRTDITDMRDCGALLGRTPVVWIDVDGVHSPGILRQAGDLFGIHPLILEDISHTTQRPKLEDMESYLFITLKMLRYDVKARRVQEEQCSFVLGANYLVSFQEADGGDVFGEVRERILSGKGRARRMGPDYLLYCLMDAVVDNYFLVLEKVGDHIEDMEEALLATPTAAMLQDLHALRREALFLRRYVWPLREVVARLQTGGGDLVRESAMPYFRDLYDHTIQVIDTIETFRDVLSGLADLYLSGLSFKTNEIMKVLTMLSTLFIPLTFLAGLYGMNFKNMPELQWEWGYFAVLGVMGLTATGMLLFFRRKKWL